MDVAFIYMTNPAEPPPALAKNIFSLTQARPDVLEQIVVNLAARTPEF